MRGGPSQVSGRRRPRAPRARVRLEVAYEDAERQVFLATRDLSESGLFLLAPEAPATGSTARLALELPGRPEILRLRGTVIRREQGPAGGFAVHLDPDAVAESSFEALRSFVAERRQAQAHAGE